MIDAFAKALTDSGAVIPDDVINIGGRFDAYRSNYFSRLISVLGDLFPVTSQLVGPDFFDALVQEYATQFPPASPLLAQYGENFADFLENFEPAHQVPYLPDVVRLEWARYVTKTNIASPPRQISSEEDILKALHLPAELAPGATLLQSPYPVETIWMRHQSDAPEPIIDWSGETVAVWQMNGEVHQMAVSGEELESVADIKRDATFMNRLQKVEEEKEVAKMIGAFVKYLNLGFLKLCDPAEGDISE